MHKSIPHFLAVAGLFLLPAASFGQTKIIPIGDSITAGYTDNPAWSDGFNHGYRSGLYTRLTNAGVDFQFVGQSGEPTNGEFPGNPIFGPDGVPEPTLDLDALGQGGHRGYGGKAVPFLNANMFGPAGWLATDDPDVILLHIGTNDRNTVGLNNFVSRTFAQKPAVKLIVAQIIPQSENNAAGAAEWLAYNAFIRDTLVPAYQAQGRDITTTNFYPDFLTNLANPTSYDLSLYSTGNHPNAAGYNVMADRWFSAVQAVIPEPTGLGVVAMGGVALLRRKRSLPAARG